MAEVIGDNPKVTLSTPTAGFESPKFGTPQFDVPKVEVPAAFRDIAEKSIAQAKDGYEKLKSAAEDTTGILEDTYASATKGASDYGLKVIEIARNNANSTFDYLGKLLSVKSISEVVELSTAHARAQFETAAAQAKELTALAQKVATDTSEPMKSGFSTVLNKTTH